MNNPKTTQPDTWIARFGDYLYSIAFFKTNKVEIAQDLVQDTFLSALKAKDHFEGRSSEKTWLTSILNNKIIDYYRKESKSGSMTEYLDDTDEFFREVFFDGENGRWQEPLLKNYISESADQYLLGKEFQTYLQKCISIIPPKLKSVFLAKYFEDDTAENICKEYDISSSNYWVIIYRAKVMLRDCLEKKGMM